MFHGMNFKAVLVTTAGFTVLAGCAAAPPPPPAPPRVGPTAHSIAPAVDAAPAPSAIYADRASACAGIGGKSVGNLKCQMSDGSVAQILSGADATRARATSIPVAPGTPRAWVLATTAITFEYDGY